MSDGDKRSELNIKIIVYYQYMVEYLYFLTMLATSKTKYIAGNMASFAQQLFQS